MIRDFLCEDATARARVAQQTAAVDAQLLARMLSAQGLAVGNPAAAISAAVRAFWELARPQPDSA